VTSPVTDRRRDAQWVVLLATVAATPLVFSTWTIDVFNITALTVLWLGALLAAGLDAAVGFPSLRNRPALMWPVATYLAVLGLTTITSRAPMVSFLGNYGRFGGLVTTVPIVALALMLSHRLTETPRRHRDLAVALVASGLLGSLYLWSQQLDIDVIDWLEPWRSAPRHPPGALGNSNFSGAHVAMASVPAAWLATQAVGRARVAWSVTAIVLLSGVAVSLSRGAMVAAGLGLLIVSASTRVGPLRVLGVALGAGVMTVVFAIVRNPSEGLRDDLFSSATWDQRRDLWTVVFRGFGDHPILGGGPDLYRRTFDDHAGESLAGFVSDEPHSVLFDHLDGSGLLGMFAWSWVWVAAAALAWAWRQRPETVPWAGMGAAYLAQSMVSIDVVPLQLWGWVAIAGLSGAAGLGRPRFVPAPLRSLPALITSLVCVGLMLVALGPFRADMAHRRGIEASNAGKEDQALFQLRQAVDRHEWEARFHRRLGVQLAIVGENRRDPALVDEARIELTRSLELAPGDRLAQRWLASLDD
jgi:hypothetical protein